MAIKVFDRVKETSITSGSGTIILTGAAAGFQGFGSVLSSGDQTYYTLINGNNWEVGLGTYLNSSLSRDTVLSSTNTGNLINLSGNTTAFVAYPAEVSVYRNLSRQIVADTGGILFSDGTTLVSSNLSVSGVLPSGGSIGQVLVKSGTGNYVSQWAAPSSIVPTGIDASYIANGTVSNAEFQYLDGVTSGIQGQLNLKANSSSLSGYYSVTNPSGFATNTQLSGYYLNSNPSGYSTLAQLSGYYLNSNPSGYITNSALSSYYLNSNPSGFITAATASGYYLNSNPSGYVSSAYVSGYQPLDGDLTALAAVTGVNNIYYRSATNTWSPVAIGTGLTFTSGTLSNTLDLSSYITATGVASAYVPYSGATGAVNLGAYGLTAGTVNIDDSSAFGILNLTTTAGRTGQIKHNSTLVMQLTAYSSDITFYKPVSLVSSLTASSQFTNALGTITSSTPAAFTQTWNNGAVTFNGMLMNITDTASASLSTFVDFQVGGVSKFSVDKRGYGTFVLGLEGQDWIRCTSNTSGFSIGSNSDVQLYRDGAADILALRRSTNTQTFRIYNTYSNTGNFETFQIKANSTQYEVTSLVGNAGVNRRIVFGHSSGNVLTSGIIIPTGIQQITSNLAGYTSTNDTITYGQTNAWPTQTSYTYLNGAYLYLQGTYTLDFSLGTGGMVFNNGAELKPKVDNLHNFGDPAARWKKTFFSDTLTINQVSYPSGSPQILNLVGGSHSGLPSGTENTDVMFNLGRQVQFASGNIPLQRAMRISGPTYSVSGSGIITSGVTLSISPPLAGSGCTITNRHALMVESGNILINSGNLYISDRTSPLGSSPGGNIYLDRRLILNNADNYYSNMIQISNYGAFHALNSNWIGIGTAGAVNHLYEGSHGFFGLYSQFYGWSNQSNLYGSLYGFTSNVANVTDLRSETSFGGSNSPQILRIHNTYTSTGVFEAAILDWQTTTNTLRIGTTQAGTGAARPLQLVTSGVARVTVSSSGYVTIGAYTLPTGDGASNQVLTTDGAGTVTWQTVSGSGGSLTGTPSGVVYFNSAGNATSSANLMWNSGTSNLNIIGTLTATSKSFLIPHPISSGKMLQYACLEGPENGVYVRGTTSLDFIDLPDYWSELVNDNITVSLTSVGQFQPLYVISKSKSRIVVGGVSGLYDYVVYGERKDISKLEVERWA